MNEGLISCRHNVEPVLSDLQGILFCYLVDWHEVRGTHDALGCDFPFRLFDHINAYHASHRVLSLRLPVFLSDAQRDFYLDRLGELQQKLWVVRPGPLARVLLIRVLVQVAPSVRNSFHPLPDQHLVTRFVQLFELHRVIRVDYIVEERSYL